MSSHPHPDKWLWASQMQKAIRWGLPEVAAEAAHILGTLDGTMARQRLAVIALEEMGAACPQRILEDFQQGWTAEAVRTRGGVPWLSTLAHDWAALPKDRTPNTWMACRAFLSQFERTHGAWASLTPEYAADLAWSSQAPWWERGLAAWRAAGTVRFPGRGLPEVAGNLERWWDVCADAGAPEWALELGSEVGRHQREAHPLFMPLVGTLQASTTPAPSVLTVPPLAPVFIGPWLSCTLDKHTSLGKRSIALLLQRTPDLQRLARQKAWSEDTLHQIMGTAWFWMEGGWVHQRLDYPGSRQIEREGRLAWCETWGLTPEEFRTSINPTVAHWHTVRAEVWEQVATHQSATSSSSRARPTP